AAGQVLRRRVFGAPASSAKSPTQELAPDLGRISDEVLFGQIWSRPGLELAHRSMITIAALTALGREPELKAHIRGGLNVGLRRGADRGDHSPAGLLRRAARRACGFSGGQGGVRSARWRQSLAGLEGLHLANAAPAADTRVR